MMMMKVSMIINDLAFIGSNRKNLTLAFLRCHESFF